MFFRNRRPFWVIVSFIGKRKRSLGQYGKFYHLYRKIIALTPQSFIAISCLEGYDSGNYSGHLTVSRFPKAFGRSAQWYSYTGKAGVLCQKFLIQHPRPLWFYKRSASILLSRLFSSDNLPIKNHFSRRDFFILSISVR